MAPIDAPLYVLPGNHDDRSGLQTKVGWKIVSEESARSEVGEPPCASRRGRRHRSLKRATTRQC